jgi:3-oxoacyl-[acyl-carrier protein] reductase
MTPQKRSDLIADDPKFALVTGGSRGIGAHIAEAFLNRGDRVAITGRSMDRLESCRNDHLSGHENLHLFECDHSEEKSILSMKKLITKEIGTPDILVNNAGIASFKPVAEMDLKFWKQIIDTNLTGVFLTTKAFLPDMIERERGDIFMISSMAGKKGDGGASAYAASKFGLQGFSQALNYEVRKYNIRVMVLNPSSVNVSWAKKNEYGKGTYLHARDIASLIVHIAHTPGRTLIRDMDIWGTNPPGVA